MFWGMKQKSQCKDFIRPPDPIFESVLHPKGYICLVCGSNKACSGLFSTKDFNVTIPLCKQCSHNYQWYGYGILKRIKVKKLIWNLIKYKICHWYTVSWFVLIGLLKRMAILHQQVKQWERRNYE